MKFLKAEVINGIHEREANKHLLTVYFIGLVSFMPSRSQALCRLYHFLDSVAQA